MDVMLVLTPQASPKIAHAQPTFFSLARHAPHFNAHHHLRPTYSPKQTQGREPRARAAHQGKAVLLSPLLGLVAGPFGLPGEISHHCQDGQANTYQIDGMRSHDG